MVGTEENQRIRTRHLTTTSLQSSTQHYGRTNLRDADNISSFLECHGTIIVTKYITFIHSLSAELEITWRIVRNVFAPRLQLSLVD